MKAEVGAGRGDSALVNATDSASAVGGGARQQSSSSSEETLRSSSASVSSTSSQRKDPTKEAGAKVTAESANLVGKINNLVTTDLGNIVEARDFLSFGERDYSNYLRLALIAVVIYIPLQVILCMWFLYAILGWRCVYAYTFCSGEASVFSQCVGGAGVHPCFVPASWICCQSNPTNSSKKDGKGNAGSVTQKRILIVFSLRPMHVYRLLQKVSTSRRKPRPHTQVEAALNVLRMVKLFGWEWKMNQKVADKREEELSWIWRLQILDVVNDTLRWDFLHPQPHYNAHVAFSFLIPLIIMIATYATYVSSSAFFLRQALTIDFFRRSS